MIPCKRLLVGFTLIELLLVVAIIAILAAVAVPNFMEAQVRAKVSRAMNDMRTTALALEAYTVDYNVAPIDSGNKPVGITTWYNTSPYTQPTNYWPGKFGGTGTLYPGYFTWVNSLRIIAWWEYALTTPVNYLSKRTPDIFHTMDWRLSNGAVDNSSGYDWKYGNYYYRNYEHCYKGYYMGTSAGTAPGSASANCWIYSIGGYRWALHSSGPSMCGKKDQCDAENNPPWVGQPGFPSYDPTNGTKSIGYIIRTNKGVYTIDSKVYGNSDNKVGIPPN